MEKHDSYKPCKTDDESTSRFRSKRQNESRDELLSKTGTVDLKMLKQVNPSTDSRMYEDKGCKKTRRK